MTAANGAPRTLESESERLNGLYTPAFGVKIAGRELPAEVLDDIASVTYEDSVRALDGFELVVGNADVTGQPGRYVGAETADELSGSSDASQRYRLFEPSRDTVELSMGYLSETRVMISGTIITMDPEFPARGPVVLRVRGVNALHALRRKPYTTAWVNKKDSEIATSLGGLTDPDSGQARFPLPVRVSDEARGIEAPIPYVLQENQHDVEFLMQRAKLRGYVLSVGRDGDEPYLYFGPSGSDVRRRVEYDLVYGGSLLSFRPWLTTLRQVRSVTVRGWDRDTNQLIAETVGADDTRLETNRDLDRILDRVDSREDVIVDKPVSTIAEAQALAFDLLRERRNEFVRASGTTIGLADLRAGCRVRISGVGARFGGTYYVTGTTHTHDGDGYRTQFRARREEEAS
jgi:phage protein D